MRTKFTNTELVHIFANQLQGFGNGSNLFFEGNRIYSYGYHYLLAEFLDNNTILINNKSYSRSTDKHRCLLWGALPPNITTYWTLDVQIDSALNRVKDNFEKLIKSKTKGAYYIREIVAIWEKLNDFIKFRKDKNTPKDIRYKEIRKIVKKVTKEGSEFASMIEAQKETLRKLQKEQTERAIQLEKENLQKFFNYETDYLYNNYTGLVYLRFDKNNKDIETSKGVRIRKGEAAILYKKILANEPIQGGKISHYTINGIKDNNLVVGCHTIPLSEINRIGQTLIK